MFVAVLDTPLKSLLLTIWLIFLKQAFSWSKPDKNQVVRNNDLMWNIFWMLKPTLRKNWPNTEFYLVRIFPYLDWIRKNTDQKILRIWTFFAQFHLRFIDHQIKIVSKLIKYLLVILCQKWNIEQIFMTANKQICYRKVFITDHSFIRLWHNDENV